LKPRFEVTILGSSSALPTSHRNTTAQVLNHSERFFLIDCGEATQIQMRRFRINIQRIDHIFISHLHGDHIFGLPGLINTLNLLGRTKDLHIYAPAQLENFLNAIHTYIFTRINYQIIFHYLHKEGKELIYENKLLKVYSFPVSHRIDTWGFSFEEKLQPRKLIKELIEKLNIPIPWRIKLKNGEDYIDENGDMIENTKLTLPPPAPRKYVFITDTEYLPSLKNYFKETIDLLYHEATFLESEKDRAAETKHSTAKQAGEMATILNAKKLLLGHFSTRYKDVSLFIDEAKQTYKGEIVLVEDGKTYNVE
jgi:ribonuclease Z